MSDNDYDEGYRAGMQKMRDLASNRIAELEADVIGAQGQIADAQIAQEKLEELEAKLAKAVGRTKNLLYWLDVDDEFWESLTDMEKADHRQMQSEVTAIKRILTGDDNG